MKRTLSFVLFLLVLTVSCKDETEDKKESSPIKGTWLASARVTTGCINESYNENITLDANGCINDWCHKVIFTDDTFTFNITDEMGPQEQSNPYVVEGSSLIVDYGDDNIVAYPIVLNGDNLTITTSNEDTGCTGVTTYKRKK